MSIDEFGLRQDMERGAQAAALIGDEMLAAAFKHLESTFFRQWENSQLEEAEARERLYTCFRLIRGVQGVLNTTIQNGKIAEADLRAAGLLEGDR